MSKSGAEKMEQLLAAICLLIAVLMAAALVALMMRVD
jgi:hypothetical protein